ncbi:ClpP family protease, partial [Priestia megaterium]|uniref:ClpP family protease n=1 Tax=Priestia megaterium TaxID=1404 RepID=UPI000C023083
MTTQNKNTRNNNRNNNNNKKRTFILNEEVTAQSVKDIIMGIREANEFDKQKLEKDPKYKPEPIKVIVNSYGGSVYDGFALVAVIDSSETPVHTYLYGKAMSMGLLIFASGHKRYAHSLATLMYHEIKAGQYEKITGLRLGVAQYEALQDAYDRYLLSVSNTPQYKMQEAKDYQREWYMFAPEAVKYGLVDEIISSKRPSATNNK